MSLKTIQYIPYIPIVLWDGMIVGILIHMRLNKKYRGLVKFSKLIISKQSLFCLYYRIIVATGLYFNRNFEELHRFIDNNKSIPEILNKFPSQELEYCKIYLHNLSLLSRGKRDQSDFDELEKAYQVLNKKNLIYGYFPPI